MPEENCSHSWEMVDILPGFIITEKCYNTGQLSSYFSLEERPPLEEYRDGDNFWNVMESAQSIRFNLKCNKCNKLIDYRELLGLMMCTGCDEACEVDTLMKKFEPERTWIYVAFGFLPVEDKKQPSQEQIGYLEDYFNQRRKSSKSRIKIVSLEMVKDISTCYAEVIRDVDMLSLEPPVEN